MNKWERKLWFQKNKGKLIKRGTIALSVLLLVVGVIYITYSKFESTQEFTIINGKVVDNGDVKISYEYDGTKQSVPPNKADGYILTEVDCENGDGSWDDLNWKLTISNMTGKTKCNLIFSKTSNYRIVTYNVNGGNTITPAYKKIVSGEQIGTLPTPKRELMVFNGWYTQASGGTKIESTTTITSDMTIYAQWKTETETVIFNANNGGMMTGSIAGGWKFVSDPNNSGSSVNDSRIYLGSNRSNGCVGGSIWTNNTLDFSKYIKLKYYVSSLSGTSSGCFIGDSAYYSQNTFGYYSRPNSIGWYILELNSSITGNVICTTSGSGNATITYVSLIS